MPRGKSITQVITLDGVDFSHEMTAAVKMGVSETRMRKWRKDNNGPANYFINNKYYYRDSDLLVFMEDNRISTGEQL